MELIEILTPDFMYPDERGLLAQLCRGGYSQVNAVFTRQGARRGCGHYHKQTDEAFFVLTGRVRVSAFLDGESREREFSAGEMFRIRANVRHTFDYLEDTCLVVLYTRPVELPDGAKDIHTD